MKYLKSAIAAMIVVLAVVPPAKAAMMVHYDLSSLVLLSDAIVLAEREDERILTSWASATKYRIKKVYAGNLEQGKSVEILDPGYSYTLSFIHDLKNAAPDSDAVLFIKKIDATCLAPDLKNKNPPDWSVVSSGMRIMFSGKVYRFEQFSNPGPYAPVPQGRDPYDARDEIPVKEGVVLSTFEKDIKKAVGRVRKYSEAMKQPDKSLRNKQLLDMLDMPVSIHPLFPYRYNLNSFYRDALGQEIIELFHGEGDVKNLLEAVSRIGRPGERLFLHGLDGSALTAYAENKKNPKNLRLAALILIMWEKLWKEDALYQRLIGLLKDDSPEIVEAVVLIMQVSLHTKFFTKGKKPKVVGKKYVKSVRGFLVEIFEKTSDPFLRTAIIRAAKDFGIKKELAKKEKKPVIGFAVEHRGEYICYVYAYLAKNNLFLEDITALSKDGKALKDISLEIERGSSGASFGMGFVKIKYTKPAKSTALQVSIQAGFKDYDKKVVHEVAVPQITISLKQ